MQAKKSLHLSQIVSSQFLQNKFEAGLSQKKNPVSGHVCGHFQMFCFRPQYI